MSPYFLCFVGIHVDKNAQANKFIKSTRNPCVHMVEFFPRWWNTLSHQLKKTWSPNIHGSSPLKRFGSPFLHEAPWWLLWSHGCGSSSVSSTRQSLGMPTTLQGVQRAKNVAVWWRKWYWRWTNCRVEMGDFGRFWLGRCWIRRLRFFNFLGAILFLGVVFLN